MSPSPIKPSDMSDYLLSQRAFVKNNLQSYTQQI